MSADAPPPRYEPADAQPRVVVGLAAALATLVGLGLATGWLYLAPGRGAGRPEATPFADGARYRTSVAASWADYQRSTRAHLSGYGWVDRPAGIVRLPLDRAIDLVCAPAPAQGGRP